MSVVHPRNLNKTNLQLPISSNSSLGATITAVVPTCTFCIKRSFSTQYNASLTNMRTKCWCTAYSRMRVTRVTRVTRVDMRVQCGTTAVMAENSDRWTSHYFLWILFLGKTDNKFNVNPPPPPPPRIIRVGEYGGNASSNTIMDFSVGSSSSTLPYFVPLVKQ